MLGNLKLGLIILLTGIVVVFSVLVLLILIIKLYSTAVSNAQNSIEQKKTAKVKVEKTETEAKKPEQPEPAKTEQAVSKDDGTIPGEIVAAIAAAVEVIFGEGAVTVKSVKRARPAGTSRRRSAWKSAGMAENTRAF